MIRRQRLWGPTLVYSKCLIISCVLMLLVQSYLLIAQKSEQNRWNMKETDELAVCDGGDDRFDGWDDVSDGHGHC